MALKGPSGRGSGGGIVAAAKAFLAATDCDLASRFDVVAVEDGDVRIVRDAFQVDDVWPTV